MGTSWPSSVSVASLAWDKSAFRIPALLAQMFGADDTSELLGSLQFSLQLT